MSATQRTAPPETVTLEWETTVTEHHALTVERDELPENVQRAIVDSPDWEDFHDDLEAYLADNEGAETLASTAVTDRRFEAATVDAGAL